MAVIYCHSKVNYPNNFFKVFHNIEKIITAVIKFQGNLLPRYLITAVNCLITQAPMTWSDLRVTLEGL
jgi:hypothetical protein